jgi:hypothetical protein
MELFKQRVGIYVNTIPYKVGADALTDLLGGRIALLFIDAATGVTHIKSGALKALGVGTDKRIPALPDVPTVVEGGVAGFEAWAWNGLAAPTGTPPDIIAKLNAACQRALSLPTVKQRFAELSVDPSATSADEFGVFIKSETNKWRTVITEAGISLSKSKQARKADVYAAGQLWRLGASVGIEVDGSIIDLNRRCKRRARRSRSATCVLSRAAGLARVGRSPLAARAG